MIVAFTGHRPTKIGGYDMKNPQAVSIRQAMRKLLFELAPEKAITGMAQGADQLAAVLCHSMKIPFIAAVPCADQELKWPYAAQEYYHWLLGLAEEVVLVSAGEYSSDKMRRRNEWMVDRADTIIAVYDGSPVGGTANCVRYARRKRKDILIIDPKDHAPKPVRYERAGYL